LRVDPLAEGTSQVLHDGTQVAACRHCGHGIYLYPALLHRSDPWREGVYDETGRCRLGEDRARIPVLHEPTVTLVERDDAQIASACDTAADMHTLAECPTHRNS
jgi:hypothetical protein